MTRFTVVGICVACLLVGGCIPGTTPRPTVPVLPPRQIAGSTLALREYWRIPASSRGSRRYPSLAVSGGRVIFIQWNIGAYEGWVQVLSAQEGRVLWETSRGSFTSLTADDERIYLLSTSDSVVHCYALGDGRHLWTTRIAPHRIYNIYSYEGILYIHNVDDSEIRYLDARTGVELQRVVLKTPEGFPLLGRFPGLDLYRTPRTLRAVDTATQQVLWETEVPLIWDTDSRPFLAGDVFLVGDAETITAIEVESGRIQWTNWDDREEKWLASNFVVMDGFVYALNYGNRLVQLDIETGQEMGHIRFAPPEVNPSEYRYEVAADNGMVFISFNDSRELIALGP